MGGALISRAMRELAKRRHATESPERLKEITSKAGRVSWEKLSEQERQARIAKMVAARLKIIADKKKTGSKQSAGTPQRVRRTPKKK